MSYEFTDQQMAAIRSRLGKKNGDPVTPADMDTVLATPRAPTIAAAAGASADPDVPFAPAAPAAVTCPACGATSYHPDDVAEGYCGRCHDWTGPASR